MWYTSDPSDICSPSTRKVNHELCRIVASILTERSFGTCGGHFESIDLELNIEAYFHNGYTLSTTITKLPHADLCYALD
jgi:hypothetical protein